MSNGRRLSDQWGDLSRAGAVPAQGRGATAQRAERDQDRKRKRMPTEDRRRKITPTLSPRLIQKLQTICKAEGHVGKDGSGMIASPVVEDLLWVGVEAYERGELETEKVEIVQVQRRLRKT